VEIEDHIKSIQNKKRPVQPFIFIIGTSMKPKEILIFFNCIKYNFFLLNQQLIFVLRFFTLLTLNIHQKHVLFGFLFRNNFIV